ncbi:MAG TPA: magnesium transporter CorA family protein [Acidobacteriota bacterium]|nr:magnesium transporter CorA family protein [Acidobacteriota bacterium]
MMPLTDTDAIFHGVSFNHVKKTTRIFDWNSVEQELHDPDVFCWIDIEGRHINALNEVLRLLAIDLTLVSHFDEPEVLPRIVERPDCLAFYLYEIDNPERHLDTSRGLSIIEFSRMILVLGPDFAITYHRHPLDAVDYVKESCSESFRFAGKTPGFLVFLFLQRCLYDYAHLNLANDNYLDKLEEEVLSGDHEALVSKFSSAGLNILTLKKLTASLHIVLMQLVSKKSPFVSDEARASFSDIIHNTIAIRAAIDSSRDLLDGIVGNVQAKATSRTSEIARILTVISAIILPLTLIAGIYGMNFKNMPELHLPFGYFIILGIMSVIAIVLLIMFWKLGWIGAGKQRKQS